MSSILSFLEYKSNTVKICVWLTSQSSVAGCRGCAFIWNQVPSRLRLHHPLCGRFFRASLEVPHILSTRISFHSQSHDFTQLQDGWERWSSYMLSRNMEIVWRLSSQSLYTNKSLIRTNILFCFLFLPPFLQSFQQIFNENHLLSVRYSKVHGIHLWTKNRHGPFSHSVKNLV